MGAVRTSHVASAYRYYNYCGTGRIVHALKCELFECFDRPDTVKCKWSYAAKRYPEVFPDASCATGLYRNSDEDHLCRNHARTGVMQNLSR